MFKVVLDPHSCLILIPCKANKRITRKVMGDIMSRKPNVAPVVAPVVDPKIDTPVAPVVAPVVDPVEPVALFDLFDLASAEQAEKPASKANVASRQTRNAFLQPYVRDNQVPVPFKATLCMSIAQDMMKSQGVDFIPCAVVLAVAKELSFDLSMQGRKPLAQVKAQVKAMRLGTVEEVEVKKGEKAAKLTAIKVKPDLIEKLDSCRFSVLPSVA